MEVSYRPNPEEVKGSGASWSNSISLELNTMTISQKANYKKRIYQPEDWASFRAAVLAQEKVASEPIVLKKK